MSQNSSIAFVNQYLLEHTVLRPVLSDIDPKLPGLIYSRNEFDPGPSANSWSNRIGKNTMFCKQGQIDFTKTILNYSQPFDQSFDQVSDQRCLDLRASHWHKPWVVLWSGGIDSTVMLVSILRTLPPGDFKNIKIWCNNASIYENPRFFINHIKPNFECISDHSTHNMDHDVFLLCGEPGYALGLEKYVGVVEQSGFDNAGHDLLWADNRDKLVKFFTKQSRPAEWPAEINFSNWLYNAMEENILSTGLPIHTVSEWWYWLLFNQNWTTNIMHHVDHFCDQKNHSKYFENYIPWYNSNDYQLWIIHNFTKIIKMKNKSIVKQYIYTIFKDEYYLTFKPKILSSARNASRHWFGPSNSWQGNSTDDRPKHWTGSHLGDDRMFCVLNNHECLYLDKDLDRIIELLPEHINLDYQNYL